MIWFQLEKGGGCKVRKQRRGIEKVRRAGLINKIKWGNLILYGIVYLYCIVRRKK
jgi:hypothetical protein